MGTSSCFHVTQVEEIKRIVGEAMYENEVVGPDGSPVSGGVGLSDAQVAAGATAVAGVSGSGLGADKTTLYDGIGKLDLKAIAMPRQTRTSLNYEMSALLGGKHTTWVDWSDAANIPAPGAGGNVTRITNAYSVFPSYDQYAMRIAHSTTAATVNGLQNYARYNFPSRTSTTAVPVTFGFWAYKHPGSGRCSLVIRLYGGATANAADTYAAVQIDDVGPQFVSIDRASFPSYLGLAGGIDSIRISENPNDPLSPNDVVLVGKVFSATRGKAYLCLSFDDGLVSVYDSAFPLLSSYGFVGTLYSIVTKLGQPYFMSVAQALEMQSAGWSIGNHTNTHPAAFLNNNTDQIVTYLGGTDFSLTNVMYGVPTDHHNKVGDVFDITNCVGPMAASLNSLQSDAFYRQQSTQQSAANYGLTISSIIDSKTIRFTGRANPGVAVGMQAYVNTYEPGYMFGLRKLDTYDKILSELTASRDALRQMGFTAWMHLAYPQGGWDNRTCAAAAAAGMLTQRGTLPRINRLHGGVRSNGYDTSYVFGGHTSVPTNNFTSSGFPGAPAALRASIQHKPGISLPGCYAVNDFATEAEWGAVLDDAIANGGVIFALQHEVFLSQASVPGTQTYCLDQLCKAAVARVGQIEVVNIEQLDARVFSQW